MHNMRALVEEVRTMQRPGDPLYIQIGVQYEFNDCIVPFPARAGAFLLHCTYKDRPDREAYNRSSMIVLFLSRVRWC